MAKGKETTEEAPKSTRGRSVVLEGGEKRADYIRRRFYDDKIKRADIVKELKEKFNHEVPYQIVFQATKTVEKPVPKEKAETKPAEDASKDTK